MRADEVFRRFSRFILIFFGTLALDSRPKLYNVQTAMEDRENFI